MLIYVCECVCVHVRVRACSWERGETLTHRRDGEELWCVFLFGHLSWSSVWWINQILKVQWVSEVYKPTSVKPQLKHLSTWQRKPVCTDAACSKLRNSKCHEHQASPREILQIARDSSLNPGNQSKPFENRPWATYSGKTLPFRSCGGDAENDWTLLYGENLWWM